MSKGSWEELKAWVIFFTLITVVVYITLCVYKHQNYYECVKNRDNPPSCRELL